jgi:chemotaxis protein CheD
VLAGMTTMNIGDRNSEFVRRYLALEKIRIVAEDLQGSHPRKVAFMPRTGQVMVKKLRLQQEAGVAEREQALMRQSAQARAERLAAARKRVELFSTPAASKPKVELFSTPAAARPKVELFGTTPRPINSNNARTTEEA